MITEEQARQHIRELLEYIGDDPTRTGLQDTPDRMIRMFREMFRGYDPAQAPKVTTFPNGQDGIIYDDMVVDCGPFYSVCEHHCRTRILGLSKIGRVVDYCAARLQVQERLVHDVVEMLTEALGTENPPLGMALMMRGRHMCKESRGVRKSGVMTSTYLTGSFRTNAQTRNEFLSYIDKSGNV